MDRNYKKTIEKRLSGDKQKVLENLKQIPIISVVCQRVGVARATVYRWRSQDVKFTKQMDEAITEGINLINDVAEGKLLSEINNGNLTSIFYWLNHRHSAYNNKVEITTNPKEDQALSPEQQDAVRKALALTGLATKDQNIENKNE
ncbi:MAG: hypothetical protein NT162_00870 [Candidatus Woesebacteria bacterium]|nr:hypothetical protein [Candidatus Woesebacteria bacterium]